MSTGEYEIHIGCPIELPSSPEAVRQRQRLLSLLAGTRKPRRPSIRAQIAAAEKAGKTVTSVTLPDGTMLQFGAPAPAENSNPWLADIAKLRKQ